MSVNYSISPMPVRLKKDDEGNVVYNANKEEVLYYAKAQSAGKMTFEQFAEHVASHDSKYHKGDILAMVVEVMRCLKEQVLNGVQVQLSDLGTFSLILNGPGAPSISDFSVNTHISHVKVKWIPGEAFKNLRHDKDLKFNLVLTKKEDAKIKKVMREASPSVKPSENGQPSTESNQQTPTAKNKYTLTVTSADTDQGTVTGGGEYEEGTQVQLKATAKSGFQFQKWDDGNTSSTRTVTVTADATYTAQFTEQSNTPPSI